ncbi:pyrroline-5-carboxylate reductase [Chloroflexota bacterium]
MKIAFIGGGNMGEAILSAVLDRGLGTPQDISVSDVSDVRRQHLKQKYGVTVTGDNLEAAIKGDIVLMAIKPQSLDEVLPGLSGQLSPAQLVLSIIAGKRIETLRQGLRHNTVVRAMPNTPAQIGQGISVWTATAEVTEQQKARAGSILGVMGKEIYVTDEEYIDMATAVSGSGPAYFFLFVEALVAGSVSIGVPHDMAQQLVLQTFLGSGHFLEKSGKEPVELRRMVTSPGGTTAAALKVLEQGKFTEMVQQAIAVAYQRAKELGG